MNLRLPQEQLAGCCWLPRLVDKIRAAQQHQLPLIYRLALGSGLGVDGYFLRHFRISFQVLRHAVQASENDGALASWFTQQPHVRLETIQTWNHFAPNIGRQGHAGYVSRHLLKWVFMPKSIAHPVSSLFEAIEQDEQS